MWSKCKKLFLKWLVFLRIKKWGFKVKVSLKKKEKKGIYYSSNRFCNWKMFESEILYKIEKEKIIFLIR